MYSAYKNYSYSKEMLSILSSLKGNEQWSDLKKKSGFVLIHD